MTSRVETMTNLEPQRLADEIRHLAYQARRTLRNPTASPTELHHLSRRTTGLLDLARRLSANDVERWLNSVRRLLECALHRSSDSRKQTPER